MTWESDVWNNYLGLFYGLTPPTPFDAMMAEIKKFVANGMSQQAVMEILQLFYKSTDPEQREPIREIMDIVSGFCTPEKRLFPTAWKEQN